VPLLLTLFRARAIATDHVPNGPVILTPNHGSFMDHFFAGAFLRRRVRFMAKSQLFQPGPASYIFGHGGVFPVRRGHHDEESFKTAFALLDLGEALVMYPEGGRSRTGRVADTAKPGVGRLALESGAPIVPVAILNSYKLRNWKRLRFPKVVVQYGQPFRVQRIPEPTREQQQEVADYVLDRIRELHTELSRLGYPKAMRELRRKRRAEPTPSPQRPPSEVQAPRSPSRAS
jgi:1-acyl-sn-glycerol-3-phosphate acyltransferase